MGLQSAFTALSTYPCCTLLLHMQVYGLGSTGVSWPLRITPVGSLPDVGLLGFAVALVIPRS